MTTKLKIFETSYQAYAIGPCSICEKPFEPSKLEWLVKTRERTSYGIWHGIAHLLCAIEERKAGRAE